MQFIRQKVMDFQNSASVKLWRSLFLIQFLFWFSIDGAFAQEPEQEQEKEVSCNCEKFSCGPCETEINVEFYTNKCGPQLSKIKSCKKPVCEPVVDQDKCLAKLNKKESGTGSTDEESRLPAAVNLKPDIGLIEIVVGQAQVKHENEAPRACEKGAKLYESDRIITQENSKVKIKLKTADELHINANSNVLIEQFLHQDSDAKNPEAKKTAIKLDFGKIRARIIKQKYNDQDNKFEISTKTAVAGVRGTDFVMSYDEDVKSSQVEMLSGAVEVSAQNSGVSTGEKVFVSAGQSCGVVMRSELAQITPPKELDPKSLKSIDQMTEVKDGGSASQDSAAHAKDAGNIGQVTAKNSDSVCSNPSADYKKCAWFCEGNPKSQKKCRTDLKNVSCVRKMCGANGQWTLPSRMPSSQGGQCDGQQPVVRDCGDFW